MLSTLKRTVLKKRTAIATLMVAAVAAVGYAYWTADGTGTGSATTGSTSAIKVYQTSPVTGLYPGGDPQNLSGDFKNPNPGAIKVDSITASVNSLTNAGPNCDKADYIIGGSSVIDDSEIPSGDHVSGWHGLTIRLKDTAVNQDDCKGATVNIDYQTQTS